MYFSKFNQVHRTMKTSHAEKTTAPKSHDLNREILNFTIDSKKTEINNWQLDEIDQFQKYLLLNFPTD